VGLVVLSSPPVTHVLMALTQDLLRCYQLNEGDKVTLSCLSDLI